MKCLVTYSLPGLHFECLHLLLKITDLDFGGDIERKPSDDERVVSFPCTNYLAAHRQGYRVIGLQVLNLVYVQLRLGYHMFFNFLFPVGCRGMQVYRLHLLRSAIVICPFLATNGKNKKRNPTSRNKFFYIRSHA